MRNLVLATTVLVLLAGGYPSRVKADLKTGNVSTIKSRRAQNESVEKRRSR